MIIRPSKDGALAAFFDLAKGVLRPVCHYSPKSKRLPGMAEAGVAIGGGQALSHSHQAVKEKSPTSGGKQIPAKVVGKLLTFCQVPKTAVKHQQLMHDDGENNQLLQTLSYLLPSLLRF